MSGQGWALAFGPGPVVGHIEPDAQALALATFALDMWGPLASNGARSGGQVVGHISAWTRLQRDDEQSEPSHSDGPASRSPNPKQVTP